MGHGDADTHRRATDLHARRQGELLQQGARCLANLSLNEANEAALVASNRADKLGPIMIAICAHEDVDVKRLAAMALANLAAYPSLQLTLVADGVLSPVSDMLASGIPDIELQAARCLAALSQLMRTSRASRAKLVSTISYSSVASAVQSTRYAPLRAWQI